jgi:hypothetical protein
VKNGNSTAAITAKYVPYLCKLGLPGHKMVGFGNVSKAETDRKFLRVATYFSQHSQELWVSELNY